MRRTIRRNARSRNKELALAAAVLLATGCTYYEVAPGTYATAPISTFDRSWSAVVGAFTEEGMAITIQDRSAGVVRGSRGGIEMTGTVRTQADGSVRVQFATSGATGRDPELIDRVSRAYDRRMGR